MEFAHRSLLSPEGQMRTFGEVVEPAAGRLVAGIADQFHRGFVRPEPIGHDDIRIAMALHGLAQKS